MPKRIDYTKVCPWAEDPKAERRRLKVWFWRFFNEDKVVAARARSRAKRRATGAHQYRESVVPSQVFERDGWKCKGCGCATPREKIGTQQHDAPTLDHIIPIALGGPHTEANLQCLCSRCNIRKRDYFRGQLRMF